MIAEGSRYHGHTPLHVPLSQLPPRCFRHSGTECCTNTVGNAIGTLARHADRHQSEPRLSLASLGLALFLAPLAQPHPRVAAVLVDEGFTTLQKLVMPSDTAAVRLFGLK
jgi:hypothetical protein